MLNDVIRYRNKRNGDAVYSNRFWEEKTINGKQFIDAVRQDPSVFRSQRHFYMLKEALEELK